MQWTKNPNQLTSFITSPECEEILKFDSLNFKTCQFIRIRFSNVGGPPMASLSETYASRLYMIEIQNVEVHYVYVYFGHFNKYLTQTLAAFKVFSRTILSSTRIHIQ